MMGGLYGSWPCVLSCEGYVGGLGGGLRQMLGAVLEAVAPDLPMCPLMGHMGGHCCHPPPLCHTSCKGPRPRFRAFLNNKGVNLGNNAADHPPPPPVVI